MTRGKCLGVQNGWPQARWFFLEERQDTSTCMQGAVGCVVVVSRGGGLQESLALCPVLQAPGSYPAVSF